MTTNVADAERTWNRDSERAVEEIYLPEQILARYIAVALRDVSPRRLEEGGDWYADVTRFPGVWATGASPKECLDALSEVLREWVVLKLVDGDRDVPVVDDIDLTVLGYRR